MEQQPDPISKSVADFKSIGPATEVIAGQLTDLMLRGDFDTEFSTAINNMGNDAFTFEQRLSMFELYRTIKGLRLKAAEALKDIPEQIYELVQKEIIRALFKGQIALEGMDENGFAAEIKKWASKFKTPIPTGAEG